MSRLVILVCVSVLVGNALTWCQEPGDETDLAALVKQLADGDSTKRAQAATALATLGPKAKDAIPSLRRSLADDRVAVRIQAALAVYKIDGQLAEPLPVLFAARYGNDATARAAAEKVLGQIGPGVRQAMPWAIESVKQTDPQAQKRVVDSLARHGLEAAPALIDALEVDQTADGARGQSEMLAARQRFRGVGMQALAALGKPLVPSLVELLQARPARLRSLAADVMGLMGPDAEAALTPLAKALADRDASVRQSAVNAIGRLGKPLPAAVPVLVAALNHKDPMVRRGAITGLQPVGPAETPPVATPGRRPAMVRPSGAPEAQAVTSNPGALAPVAPELKAHVAAFRNALQDPEGYVRVKAAGILVQLNAATDEALPILVADLDASDQLTRQLAYRVLEWCMPSADAAVPLLKQRLQDAQPTMRMQAARLLLRAGGDASDAALPVILDQAKDKDVTARREALLALKEATGTASGPRVTVPAPVLEALLSALSDPDALVKAYAAERLWELRRYKEALPVVFSLAREPTRGEMTPAYNVARQLAFRTEHGNTNLAKALLEVLPSVSGPDRQLLLQVLGRTGPPPPESLAAILALLGDPDEGIRAAGASLLARMESMPKEAVAVLLQSAKEGDKTVQSTVLDALAKAELGNEAVPLLTEFAKLKDPATRQRLRGALAALGPDAHEAIPLLSSLVKEPDRDLAIISVKALARLGGNAWPHVLAALKHPDAGVRTSAANSLGQARNIAAESCPKLLALVKDNDARVRQTAASSLGRLGPVGVPHLRTALKEPDEAIRQVAVRAIGSVGERAGDAVPDVEALLLDPSVRVRVEAAIALWRITRLSDKAFPVLLECLSAEDVNVRQAAARHVWYLRTTQKTAAAALTRALADDDPIVRAMAAATLAHVPGQANAVLPALIEGLQTAPLGYRPTLAHALVQLGPQAKPALPALLAIIGEKHDGRDVNHWSSQSYARSALAAIGKDAVPPLVEALLNASETERHAFGTALASIGPDAGSELVRLAAHADPSVRAAAIRALGSNSADAKELDAVVLRALSDPDPKVRSAGVDAAGRLHCPAKDVLPPLIKMLQDANYPDGFNILQSLGQLGPDARAAVPVLLGIVKDPQSRLRLNAVRPLIQIDSDNPEIVQALVAMARENQSTQAPLTSLGGVGPNGKAAAVPVLREFLASDLPTLRIDAAIALAKLGVADRDVVAAFVEVLQRRRSPTVSEARFCQALGNLGPAGREAVPALLRTIRQFGQGMPDLYEALVKLQPKPEEVRATLLDLSGEGGPYGGTIAAAALARIDPDARAELLPILQAALRDEAAPHPTLRFVIPTLGELGPDAQTVVPDLTRILRDKASHHRIVAASALWKIERNPEAVLPVLLEVLESKTNVLSELLAALGELGHAAAPAVPKLTPLLKHRDWQVRRQAADALAKIATQ